MPLGAVIAAGFHSNQVIRVVHPEAFRWAHEPSCGGQRHDSIRLYHTSHHHSPRDLVERGGPRLDRGELIEQPADGQEVVEAALGLGTLPVR